MTNLQNHDYQQFLADHDFVVADYYADWCPPCQAFGPVFESFAQTYPQVEDQAITYVKINIDEAGEAASEAGVMSIPTLIIYKKGEEVDRHIGGGLEESDLLRFITENL